MAKQYGYWKGKGGLTPRERLPQSGRRPKYNQPLAVNEAISRRRRGTKRWSFVIKSRKGVQRLAAPRSQDELIKRRSVRARFIRALELQPIRFRGSLPFDLLVRWQLPQLADLLAPLDRIFDPGSSLPDFSPLGPVGNPLDPFNGNFDPGSTLPNWDPFVPDPGNPITDPGSSLPNWDSFTPDPGGLITDPGSSLPNWDLFTPDPGGLITDPGSTLPNWDPFVPDPGNPITDPGSSLPNWDSFTPDPGGLITDPGSSLPNWDPFTPGGGGSITDPGSTLPNWDSFTPDPGGLITDPGSTLPDWDPFTPMEGGSITDPGSSFPDFDPLDPTGNLLDPVGGDFDPGSSLPEFPTFTFPTDNPFDQAFVFILPRIVYNPPELSSPFLPELTPLVLPVRPILPEAPTFELATFTPLPNLFESAPFTFDPGGRLAFPPDPSYNVTWYDLNGWTRTSEIQVFQNNQLIFFQRVRTDPLRDQVERLNPQKQLPN